MGLLSPSVERPGVGSTPSILPDAFSFPLKIHHIWDSCQKRVRLLGSVTIFSIFVSKARRKDRENSAPQEEPRFYLEEAVLERKLSDNDLRNIVDLPPGIDYNEWLASHTLALFDHINLIYGTISEFCTMSGCPDMTGPNYRTYLWFDEKGKKTKVAAPQYIDYVMTFTQKTTNDEAIFPTKYANDFPSSFESIVKKILRLLFHVLAHVYHAHFREVVLLNVHAHLNCVFAHYTVFNEQFVMVDEKETEVLRDLVEALKLYGDTTKSDTSSLKTAPVEIMDSDDRVSMPSASPTPRPDESMDVCGVETITTSCSVVTSPIVIAPTSSSAALFDLHGDHVICKDQMTLPGMPLVIPPAECLDQSISSSH